MSSKANTHAQYKSQNLALCTDCTPHTDKAAEQTSEEIHNSVVNTALAHSIRFVRTHAHHTNDVRLVFNVSRPSDFTNIEIWLRKSMSPFGHRNIFVLSFCRFLHLLVSNVHARTMTNTKENATKKKPNQNGTTSKMKMGNIPALVLLSNGCRYEYFDFFRSLIVLAKIGCQLNLDCCCCYLRLCFHLIYC